MYEVRVAGHEDISEMHRVRMSVRENRLTDPARVQVRDYEVLLESGGCAWVAEKGNRVVGFAFADLARSNVWALFVEHGQEGQGIGRSLHDTMMNWLFSSGAQVVWLGTERGTRAESFYRSAGWSDRGTTDGGEIRFEMSHQDWLSRIEPARGL